MAIRRKSGFECPWSLHQVLSWVCYLFEVFVFFIQIFPDFKPVSRYIITIVDMGSLVVVFIVMLILTKSDPSDPLVSSFIKSADHR
jgi:hypothetical protein